MSSQTCPGLVAEVTDVAVERVLGPGRWLPLVGPHRLEAVRLQAKPEPADTREQLDDARWLGRGQDAWASSRTIADPRPGIKPATGRRGGDPARYPASVASMAAPSTSTTRTSSSSVTTNGGPSRSWSPSVPLALPVPE